MKIRTKRNLLRLAAAAAVLCTAAVILLPAAASAGYATGIQNQANQNPGDPDPIISSIQIR